MYTGSYTNHWGSYIVLMNIIVSSDHKFIRSNKMFSVDIKDLSYENNFLSFNKFTCGIGDIGKMLKSPLLFEKTDLKLTDFTNENNFMTYRLC